MGLSTKSYSRVPLEEQGITDHHHHVSKEKSLDDRAGRDQSPGRRLPIRNSIAGINPWILHLLIFLVYTSIYVFYVQTKLVRGYRRSGDLIYSECFRKLFCNVSTRDIFVNIDCLE
jgi:hypothetical protein